MKLEKSAVIIAFWALVMLVVFLMGCDVAPPPPTSEAPSESETRTDACISKGGNPDQCTFEEMRRTMMGK